MRKKLGLILLGSLALFAGTDWSAAGRQWWSHVQFLARDQLQGRNVGSPGFDKAADHVAAEFERAGLGPGGTNHYFQPVQLTEISLIASRSKMAIVRAGTATEVAIPAEAILGYGADSAPSLEAPIVFAGYGLRIPEAHYDDLQGISVRGAVVAYINGGPDKINGNLRSHYSSSKERWNALRAAGAVGIISIPNPKEMEIPWNRQAAAWGRPRVTLADASLAPTPGLKFSATWNPDKAEDLFARSGHTLTEILETAKQQGSLPHFQLSCSMRASTIVSTRPIESKNVVGIRDGNDPKLKDEYVVLSAHLDHLGPLH